MGDEYEDDDDDEDRGDDDGDDDDDDDDDDSDGVATVPLAWGRRAWATARSRPNTSVQRACSNLPVMASTSGGIGAMAAIPSVASASTWRRWRTDSWMAAIMVNSNLVQAVRAVITWLPYSLASLAV